MTVGATTPGVEAIIVKLEEIDLRAIRRSQAKRKIPQPTMVEGDVLDADMGHCPIHRHIDRRSERRQVFDALRDIAARVN